MDDRTLRTRFLEGTLDPEGFMHATHVRLTYLLLRERALPETLIALRDGLSRLASAAGHPEKYHETITFAFAAVINERMQRGDPGDFEAFARMHPDLLEWGSGSVLSQLYSPNTLAEPSARRTFLLPRAGRPERDHR